MIGPPNILLIVVDTLRADSLAMDINNLPNFQYILSRSTAYTNAYSPASWTLPSHASLFSGLYPSEHGMDFKFEDMNYFKSIVRFPAKAVPLPEKLRRLGYDTVSIGANPLLGRDTAFEEGFRYDEVVGPWAALEQYERRMKEAAGNRHHLPWDDVYYASRSDLLKRLARFSVEIGAGKTMEIIGELASLRKTLAAMDFPVHKGSDQILANLSAIRLEEPFFLFLNLMEMHEPYSILPNKFPAVEKYCFRGMATGQFPNRVKVDRVIEGFRRQVRTELRVLDAYLGKILNHLKARGLFEKTRIIITSDHGQSLGEDNFVGHKYLLNDALVHAPMIIMDRNDSPRSIRNEYVSLVDIPSIIYSWLDGRPAEFPHREYIFSEAYGLNGAWWDELMGELANRYRPVLRKRIWSESGCSLTLNGSAGKVEEFSCRGVPVPEGKMEDVKKELLREMEIFAGNSNFQVPLHY